MGTVNASSANITVTNNNQISTIDQGTPTITRTSTVTVLDTTATLGYTLSARVPQNTIPNATVTIYSTASTTCTQTSPCTITTNPTPITILETNTANAIQPQGHTTQWTITITMPTNTPQGNYLLDIAYSEDPILPPPEPDPSNPTTYGAMQLMTNTECSTTRGTTFDARNGQTYYVQKIANSGANGEDLCWMETNLRYAGNGNYDSSWGYIDDRYATFTALAAYTTNPNDNIRPLTMTHSGYFGGSVTNAYTVAGVADAGGSTTLDVAIPSNNTTFYGYLYNWCSAMGGQPNACNNTGTTGFDATTSICPAGWRLPTGNDDGDFEKLNNAINNGNTDTDASFRQNFLTAYHGHYYDALSNQISDGEYWSSTAYNATNAHYLYLYNNIVATSGSFYKYGGIAVRCVL